MTLNVSRSEVYQALGQVRHPEIQSRNLVALGMIREVIVEGSQVYVMLALPSLDVPIKQELVEAIRQAVTELEDGLKVEVKLTEMEDTQIEAYHSPAFEQITDRVVELAPIRELEPLLNRERE